MASKLADSSATRFDEKCTWLSAAFAPYYSGELQTFASSQEGYRMRAEFRIWHEDASAHYAMNKPGEPKSHYFVTHFEPAYRLIQDLMPPLLEQINQSQILKQKLFQVEFLSSTIDQALVTLIYHRPLDEQWLAQAKALGENLQCQIIGRSRKQKLVLETDHIYECFEVDGHNFRYQQIESSFTQPNAMICQKMLQWACQNVPDVATSDLLELYCGNGNFTIPLAKHFRRVLATEISKTSIGSAKLNCEINDIHNIEFVRMSSEEISAALASVRPFRRLKHLDLGSYQFSHVFVDPPRAGLDPVTRDLVAGFDNIIYISCNPQTLLRDLEQFCASHSITKAAFFDQFPNTPHCECAVVLQRKSV